MPPIALLLVVLIAVGGGVRSGPGSGPSRGAPAVVAADARAEGRSEGRGEPGVPSATPTFRSDWPAAISGGTAPTSVPLPREEGTDGLMGRLPFGLPNDTPTIRVEQVEWWRVYDERADWHRDKAAAATVSAATVSAAPWVRRLQSLSNYRTDPYQR